MPCNITLTLWESMSHAIKAVITTPDEEEEDHNELVQIIIAEVQKVQRNVSIWEKTHKIKNKTELKKVMDICKHFIHNGQNPIGILFDMDHQSYTPSGENASTSASGICIAGKDPTDEAIQLGTNEVKKLLEFEDRMIEAFENGLDTRDCDCVVESPFFLFECEI